MSKLSLSEYRALIRDDWAPLVGRRRFSSFEYPLTEGWYKANIPVAWVLEAIKRVKERGRTVYSLGVIQTDLTAVQRERQRARLGEEPKRASNEMESKWTGGGRQAFIEALQEIAGREGTPADCLALINRLIADAPSLNRDQAYARFGEIHHCLRREQ